MGPQTRSFPRPSVRIVLAVLLFAAACHSPVTVNEFIVKVNEDTDFRKEYTDENYGLWCAFRPTELMTLLELRSVIESGQRIEQPLFDSVRRDFNKAFYFTLSIGLKDSSDILKIGVNNRDAYARRINDMTFNMGSCVYLLSEGQDTIRASLFDYQRSYGMSPNATFLFAFPAEAIHQTNWFDLVYEDRYFGISNPVRFRFKTSQLNKKLPILNLSTL